MIQIVPNFADGWTAPKPAEPWRPQKCDHCDAEFTSLGLWSIHVNPAVGEGCKRPREVAS